MPLCCVLCCGQPGLPPKLKIDHLLPLLPCLAAKLCADASCGVPMFVFGPQGFFGEYLKLCRSEMLTVIKSLQQVRVWVIHSYLKLIFEFSILEL